MRKENETKTIYNLELHEEILINHHLKAQRVSGGWIYKYFKDVSTYGKPELSQIVFVPFNNELQLTKVK